MFGPWALLRVGAEPPTWTLVLQIDPEQIITDPHFIRVVGFITSRQVPIVPVPPNMTD